MRSGQQAGSTEQKGRGLCDLCYQLDTPGRLRLPTSRKAFG